MLRPYMPRWMKSELCELILECVFTFILSGLLAQYLY